MSRLTELHAKIDAFFARVEARHGEDMQCRTGCSDCCRVRLTVTGVEAAAIAAAVAGWPAERRRALAAQVGAAEAAGGAAAAAGGEVAAAAGGAAAAAGGVVAAGEAPRCVALDAAGRCAIYEVRPVVCRSHGVPVRLRRGSLPVVEACPRNFTRVEPASDCVLDQATLSALVLAVDRAAGGDGGRIDLAALLADVAGAASPPR